MPQDANVLISTGIIDIAINLDRRSVLSTEPGQSKFDFEGRKNVDFIDPESKRQDVDEDYLMGISSKEASRIFKLYKGIYCYLNHLSESLSFKYNDFKFDVLPNLSRCLVEGVTQIYFRVNISVILKNGQPLSETKKAEMRNHIAGQISEINHLTSEINKSEDDQVNKPRILCTHKKHYSNRVDYLDVGAAKFVYQLFDKNNEKIHQKLSSLKMGNTIFPLEIPSKSGNFFFGDSERKVKGKVIIKSYEGNSFSFNGYDLNKDGFDEDAFAGEVYIDTGLFGDHLMFKDLLNLSIGDETVVLTIKPVQNYVCMEGKPAKKYIVISVEKAE